MYLLQIKILCEKSRNPSEKFSKVYEKPKIFHRSKILGCQYGTNFGPILVALTLEVKHYTSFFYAVAKSWLPILVQACPHIGLNIGIQYWFKLWPIVNFFLGFYLRKVDILFQTNKFHLTQLKFLLKQIKS